MATIKTIIEFILSLLFVASLLSFFTTFVAVRIRYYFLKLIGKEKSIKYLQGGSGDDGANNMSHGCLNLIVGLIIFFFLAFVIAYILYVLD